MTKKCTKCLEMRDECDFPFKLRSTGRKATRCKLCLREASKTHYLNNRDRYIKRVSNRKIERQNDVVTLLFNYLRNHPCIDCGETDVLVLEFDHVRGQKRCDVSTLVASYYSFKTIEDEISKCDVRCCNCHRRRTYKVRNTKRYQLLQAMVNKF